MAVEVEAKLLADGPQPLADLAAAPNLGPGLLGSPRTFAEVDAYLDTVGGRLAAARWACRLRDREGMIRVSLKGPAQDATGTDAIQRRPEVEGPATWSYAPADWPPSAARTLLEELSGGEPLDERFTLRQRRTERAVVIDERRLGTLTLDEVRVTHLGRTLGAPLYVVELELDAGGDPGDLERLAGELAARPGLALDPRTKLDHALERIRTS